MQFKRTLKLLFVCLALSTFAIAQDIPLEQLQSKVVQLQTQQLTLSEQIANREDKMSLLKSLGASPQYMNHLEEKVTEHKAHLQTLTDAAEEIKTAGGSQLAAYKDVMSSQEALLSEIEAIGPVTKINEIASDKAKVIKEEKVNEVLTKLKSHDFAHADKVKSALSAHEWDNVLKDHELENLIPKNEGVTQVQEKVNKAKGNVKTIDSKKHDYQALLIEEKQVLKDKLFLETDFDLDKSDMSLLGVSPILGYSLTDKLDVGVGTYWQQAASDNLDFSGTRMLTRFHLLKDRFAVQLENILSGYNRFSDGFTKENMVQRIGGRFSIPTPSNNNLMNLTILRRLNNPGELSAYPSQLMSTWQMKMGISF